MTKSTSKTRIKSLDIFRGIAVLLVVLFHYTARIPPEHLNADQSPVFVVDWGWIGVYLFFVVSGFCISATLMRDEGAIIFTIRRLLRILPPYIAAVLFAFIVIQLLAVPEFDLDSGQYHELKAGIIDLMANLFMLREIGFPWLDGVFWSLLVEIKFYLMLAVLYFLSRNPKQAIIHFTTLSAIAFTLWVVVMLLGQNIPAKLFKHLLIAPYLPFFCLGIALNGWMNIRHQTKKEELLRISVFLLFCFISLLITHRGVTHHIAFAALIGALMATIMLPAFEGWFAKWFRAFGRIGIISYSLYLFHNNLGLALIKQLNLYFDYNFSILVAILFAFIIASISYSIFEIRLSKRLLKLALNLTGMPKTRPGSLTSR